MAMPGRNIIIGPGNQTWTLGFYKNFLIAEPHALQFRVEFFNAFNNVNLNNPDTGFDSPNLGRIFGSQSGASDSVWVEVLLLMSNCCSIHRVQRERLARCTLFLFVADSVFEDHTSFLQGLFQNRRRSRKICVTL